ncbi:hypothetical protein OB69_14530 [Roseivirga seohaensis subsp. aquiponti]|uniref:Bacteriocin n=1 Tax=Roseivirga seohaensis subsp. aquiponti TaxID=1566026 RepID=A0A0L8AI44_9BACT|nr:hypothetical protein [Roseivirga seohaensis]KOF01951.1 hypothetical protein OB69_14530 [Roseivirga seohaensis subsp. aquiponti]
MKIIGEKLTQQEMLGVKGGLISCYCTNSPGSITACQTLVECMNIMSWLCDDGEAWCKEWGQETVE